MRETEDGFGEQDEDTEIQNLPLYTEHKADGIYRYWRRVPKTLVERVGRDTFTATSGAPRRRFSAGGRRPTRRWRRSC